MCADRMSAVQRAFFFIAIAAHFFVFRSLFEALHKDKVQTAHIFYNIHTVQDAITKKRII